MPGGRPVGTTSRDKPFRDALRAEIIAAGEGDFRALRPVARALLAKAKSGDISAIKELGDRLDGKPIQQIEGTGDRGELIVRWLKDGEEP